MSSWWAAPFQGHLEDLTKARKRELCWITELFGGVLLERRSVEREWRASKGVCKGLDQLWEREKIQEKHQ